MIGSQGLGASSDRVTGRLGDWETSDFPVSSFRAKREIFVIRGKRLTLSPHVPRTSPLFSSVFHTACALSAPSGHLPLEGKADDTKETYYQETFGHRLIYTRGEAATFIPNSSFLIPHSRETFIPHQEGSTPHRLTSNQKSHRNAAHFCGSFLS